MSTSGENDDTGVDDAADSAATQLPEHGTIKGQNTTQYTVDNPKGHG